MDLVAFHGRFFHEDAEAVRDLLQGWLGLDTLAIKEGRSGPEMYYEEGETEMYCEGVQDGGPLRFLLSGQLPGEAAEARLRELLRTAQARAIETSLSYEPVDEAGDATGAEVELT